MNNLHPHTRMRSYCALLVALLALVSHSAWAQPCACTNCPQPIPAVSDFTVCYDVAGLSNATLGANGQGICGVQVSFAHDYIENLSITLLSPAGQRVQLVGPGSTGISTIATAGARWDLDFRSCGSTISPVPGTGPQFSGDNTVWQVFGNYTGSYYPYADCLSDFNTGPANGQWCLEVESNAVITNNDQLFDFQVEFCDDSGPGCCYAEVPLWTQAPPDTTLCEGDPALDIAYGLDNNPPTGYAQRLLVTRNDTVFSYANGTLDLQAASLGTYELCGLEYFLGDANQLPNPGTPISRFRDSLMAQTLCASYATDCRVIQIVERPALTVLDEQVCEGDSVAFAGNFIDQTGVYRDTLSSIGGCDSLVELRLTVYVRDTIDFREDLCQGDTLDFFGRNIVAGGDYEYPLTNRFGCDSLVRLIVVEYPSYTETRDTAFCAGGQVILGGTVVSASGAFRQNLSTVAGCDSTVTWNVVSIATASTISTSINTLTCAQPSATLTASPLTNPMGVAVTRSWLGPSGALGSDLSVIASQAGWYYLRHEGSFAGVECSSVDSVFIQADPNRASVTLPDSLALNCRLDSLVLRALTDLTVVYTYSWFNGLTSLGVDDTLLVTTPGAYSVAVERQDNGCVDTASVVIVSDLTPPSAIILPFDTLTCSRDSVVLSAEQLSPAGATTANWTDPGGAPLPTSSGQAVARTPGQYLLTVLDTSNGCETQYVREVIADTTGLQLQIVPPDTLSCSVDSVDLRVLPSEAASFRWMFNGAFFSSTGPSIRVGQAGRYSVEATALQTGCVLRRFIDVAADTVRPTAVIATPDTLKCFPPIAILDASASMGAHPLRFEWRTTSPDVLAGTLTPRLRTAGGGAYTVLVTDTVNGCIDSATVRVIEDRRQPTADAGPDALIDCTRNTVQIGGANSTGGTGVQYRWSALNGGLVGFPNGPSAVASTGGTFVLTVRDSTTGCQSRDTVMVTLAQGVPVVVVPDTTVIACGTTSALLSGLGSSTGANLIYRWTTADGRITSDSSQAVIDVSSSGYYRLTIRDTLSNCEAFAEAVVIEACPASVIVASPDTIDCRTGPEIRLFAQGTSGPGNFISWRTRDGQLLADANTLTPLVRGPGTYVVEVTQTFSASKAMDSVVVVLDTVAPRGSIVGDTQLSCAEISACVSLSAAVVTSVGETYAWTTLSGQFCGLDTVSQTIRINAPGLYEVEVTNPRNGCTDVASINVTAEAGLPIPDAGPNRLFGCNADSVVLEAVVPSPSVGRSWWWTDDTGARLGAFDTSVQTVRSPGTYAFVVFDTLSGCEAADTTFVIEQLCAPDARPLATGPLTCVVDTVLLQTPVQAGMQATWFNYAAGIGPLFGFDIQVTVAGEYTVIVEDLGDGQLDSASVTVDLLTAIPQAVGTATGTLTCADTTVLLDGRNSIDAYAGRLTYGWYDSANALLGNAALQQATAAGPYLLEVTSLTSGCIDTTTVFVAANLNPPSADALAASLLDCNNTSVRLHAANSTGQGSLSYRWESLNDPTRVFTETQVIQVDEAGSYVLNILDQANGCLAADTVEVLSFLPGNLQIADTSYLPCVGGSTTLSLTGALASGSVQWQGPSAGCIDNDQLSSIEASCRGTYRWQVTDANSTCSYDGEVAVLREQRTFGLAVAGDSILTCTNPQVVIYASADSSQLAFEWTGVVTGFGESLQVGVPGRVLLTATDLEGCLDTLGITVSQDTLSPQIALQGGDTLNCNHDELLLQASGVLGRSYAYRWAGASASAGDTLAGLRVLEPGTYTVELTDLGNGCSSSAQQTVALDTVSPSLMLEVLGVGQLSCDVSEVVLEAEIDPADSQLRWLGPAGQAFDRGAFRQNVQIGGVYQVSARHPRTGCETVAATVVIDISEPIEGYVLGVTGELGCLDTLVSLQADLPPGVNLSWTNRTGEPIDPLEVDSAGIFVALLLDTLTGCRTRDSVEVETYAAVFTLGLAPADSLTCEVDEVVLQIENQGNEPAGLSYLWVSPLGDTVRRSSDLSYRVGAGGVWSVQSIEPITGCVQWASVEVPVSAEAITGIELEVVDATCPGERDGIIEVLAVEGGDGNFSYSLGDSLRQRVGQFGLLSSGQYQLDITDGNGCSYEIDVTVDGSEVKPIELPVVVTAALGDTVCITASWEGRAPDSLRWSGASPIGCDTCRQFCVLTDAAQRIEVVAYYDGCAVTASTEVEVVDSPPAVWPTAFSPNGDGANDTWVPIAVRGQLVRARVFDRWGSMIFSTAGVGGVLNESWDGTLNGRPLRPAVFLVEVTGVTVGGRSYTLYGDLTLVR